MASRNQAAFRQKQKDAAVPLGKQKPGPVADGKNRRAFEDIGNLLNVRITEGKPQPQISRPATGSFEAQLLLNAQAAAANKKPLPVVPDGGVEKSFNKAFKQKVAVKPKPAEIIEISPDTDKELKQANKKNSHRTAERRKVHTLTSVLTARSKVACRVTETKDPLYNIDALDGNDELAVVDYVEDIYKFYTLAENSSGIHDYMDSQVDINAKMRAILADWLIEVHHKFDLMPETLYLTMYIVDRYLSMKIVLKKELQLVGVSAMLIACKYEEIWAPEVSDLICISAKAYSREQILAKEKEILNKLEWSLTVPTPYVFLVRFLKAALSDKEMEHMVFFFAELGLIHYSVITYCPSMIAASAVYAGRCTLRKCPRWTETLKSHTGFSEPQLLDCAQLLVNFHASAPLSKQKAVYRKYSSARCGSVALHPPATKLLEELKASST